MNLLQGIFDKVREKARELRMSNRNADGLAFWRPIKAILSKYTDIRASTFKKLDSKLTHRIMILPEKCIDGYGEEHMIELHHFMIQAVRIPIQEQPTILKIIQIALNLGQYEGLMREKSELHLDLDDYIEEHDIKEINTKIREEIMMEIIRIPVLQ